MPFGRLFDRKGRRRRQAVARLYASVLERARDPWLYAEGGVPDTFDGRFEMMIWHLAPIALRLRDADAEAKLFSQDLFDGFLDDMDRSMREAAVGDIAIPKRLKKMVRVWFGRIRALEEIERGGIEAAALAPVLERNLYPDTEPPALEALAERLAAYWRRVAATPTERLATSALPEIRTEEAA